MQRIMLFELLMQWTPGASKNPKARTSTFTATMKLIGRKDFLASISAENLNQESKFAFIERY